MSSMLNAVVRKEWTPKWDRWTLDTVGTCPALVHSDTKRTFALFKPGCTEEEFYAWLGWRVWQLRKTSWASYKDVYMFIDAATDIRGWERE